MQIAILKCKKDVILEGGPIKDPNFAKVGDIVVGAYSPKNNEVFTLVEGQYVNIIEMSDPSGIEHFDLEALISEDAIDGLRKVYAERRHYW